MIKDPVPLDRYFSPVPWSEADFDEKEIRSIWDNQERAGWQELEQEFRCVILAEAGAGKSFEMVARARHLEEQGRAAFLFRIEDIKDDFEGAFEVGSADALEDWLNSKEEAWFFLDSIDEARLDNPRSFEKAIKRFAARIKPAHQRARVFISSRPYAWRALSDRILIEQLLPFKKPERDETVEHDGRFEGTATGRLGEQESALHVYLLNPLEEDDVREFAEHRNTPQIDVLVTELQRTNLMSLAARPFDLEVVLSKWKVDQTLDGRLELLQHNIDLRLKEIDPDREQRQPISLERARRGVRQLATAVILSGEPGIRIPDSTHSDNGINAQTVLGDWKPTEVQMLLERGIFNDVLYGIVRFRHREVRELLAAEWFNHQLSDGSSRQATESLFFREQYGHAVITPRLRPVLPWLILFDDEMRHKALEISPEIAVEGGDAARLPFAERQALLHNIVRRIVDDADEGSAYDNTAIARIAQQDLTDDTLRLINDHRDKEEAIFFLGRLVWQGEMTACVPVLSEIAGDQSLGIYARIAATRAVMTCGDREQQHRLWDQLTASPNALPRKLLAEFVVDTEPDMVSVNMLLSSLDRLEAYQRFEATGLRVSLHGFIDRLPIHEAKCTSEPLAVIVAGLNGYLGREPHIEQRDCRLSAEFAWLLGPATHAVERLVSARSSAALLPDALAVMLQVPVAKRRRVEGFYEHKGQLHELVPAWTELNDALFWRSVEEAREQLDAKKSEKLINDLPVQRIGHYWKFEAERFGDALRFVGRRDFVDDKLVALSLAHRLFLQADKPDGWLTELERAAEGNSALTDRLNDLLNPRKSQSDIEWEEEEAQQKVKRKQKEEERNRNRAERVERLRASPDVVRHPPGLKPGDVSNDQLWLLFEIKGTGIGTSRGDGANWEVLISEFGEDVARAYRNAAIAHWRSFNPGLRSEEHDTNPIPCSLKFAMAGLNIEASEVNGFPGNLTETDAVHALRYLVWEINGLPRWLEQLYRARQDLVLNAVLPELRWELARTEPKQPAHYILQDLVYHAPWIHEALAPSISAWMERNEVLNHSSLGYCIDILLSGAANSKTVSTLAQSKIASNAATEQLVLWHALWIDVDATAGIPAAEKWLSNLQKKRASIAAQLLVTRLMGTRRSYNKVQGRQNFRNVNDLKALYVLMHRHIRVQDDINRANAGVFSPGLRDDAQDGRNALFDLLCEIPGKETYVALTELAKDHPNSNYRHHIKRLAYKRAEEDADLEPWSAQQVREFDQHQARTPTTHRQLFDLTVDRLNDLKAWIEHGNDSPYRTWQRAHSETEMRNLVAGRLNASSSGRFTCAQENELSNKQKPDIWMQCPQVASAVPIELKVLDKGWSGPKLCERLRNQLAGDYLREETSGCGVFLLVWQGRSSKCKWQISGKRASLQELCTALVEFWETVSVTFPRVAAIKVILIDLTVRDKKS